MSRSPSGLAPAESFDALARDPLGRYLFGPSWLVFFAPDGRFSGTIAWGDPDEQAIGQWQLFAELTLSSRFERHASVVDASRVDHISVSAFGAVSRFLSTNVERLEKHLSQLAIVHGGGLTGATTAGFLALWRMRYRARAFGNMDSALSWLGHAAEAPMVKELDAVVDQSIERAPILRDLEIFLEQHPNATPEQAARALGLSIRSLQRRLSERDTTFRGVLDTTRIRVAQRLLVESDANVTAIALRVGLNSPQHLSTLFRKYGHETPRTWRGRMRRRH